MTRGPPLFPRPAISTLIFLTNATTASDNCAGSRLLHQIILKFAICFFTEKLAYLSRESPGFDQLHFQNYPPMADSSQGRGYNIVKDPVHVHDMNAPILHCVGIEHTKLTYGFQAGNFRLTDVNGSLVKKLLT